MKMVPLLSMALLAASLVVGAAAQAQAQSEWGPQYYRDAPPMMSRQVMLCRKMCPQDFSPCDPIYFKTADGRCSGIPNR